MIKKALLETPTKKDDIRGEESLLFTRVGWIGSTPQRQERGRLSRELCRHPQGFHHLQFDPGGGENLPEVLAVAIMQ